MSACTAVWLVASVLGWAGEAKAEAPEAWNATYEAARNMLKAGRGDEAEAMLRGVVAEAEKSSPDDLIVAKPLEELASLLLDLPEKRFDEANAQLERALAIREKTQGPNHKDVAKTLIYLIEAKTRQSFSLDKTMVQRLKRAVTILENVTPKDDALNARLLHLVATSMLIGREYATAEKCLNGALKCSERAYGSQSAEVAAILDDLGDLHYVQAVLGRSLLVQVIGGWKERHGRLHRKKAIEFYLRALAMRETLLPPNDERIASSLSNIGQFYVAFGQYETAEPYLTRWLTLDNAAKTPSDKKREHVLKLLARSSWKRHDWAASRDWQAAADALHVEMNSKPLADPSVSRAVATDPTAPTPPVSTPDAR
jgi:tetratricopeptide (TPR) repeat protein